MILLSFRLTSLSLTMILRQENLQQAIVRICADVETSVRNGTVICILSDHDINEGTQPIHSLLACGCCAQSSY